MTQAGSNSHERVRQPAFGAGGSPFAPPLLRIQEAPPLPLLRWMLGVLFALFLLLLVLAAVGRIDIVAVAEGKLVPRSYLKIVQPAEQGIVRDILVREGEKVTAGQVLIRMDPVLADADMGQLLADLQRRRLAMRRIDAELAEGPFDRMPGDAEATYAEQHALHAANVNAHRNALAHEAAIRDKAAFDLAAAREVRAKLEQVLPHYQAQEAAYARLSRDGFAGQLMLMDKQRERIEKEQDLRSQEQHIQSNLALIAQSERRIAQIAADYRRALQAERMEHSAQVQRLDKELAKLQHRQGLLELRAPQAGTVKDLATHTAGTVAAPGTILMTLVPAGDDVVAEVWVGNQDIGFVRQGQDVRLKLAAYPFQKYGLVNGRISQLGADATEVPTAGLRPELSVGRERNPVNLAFRTLIDLQGQELVSPRSQRLNLAAGMQVTAEINLGERSVLEYLLSPVHAAILEAARER